PPTPGFRTDTIPPPRAMAKRQRSLSDPNSARLSRSLVGPSSPSLHPLSAYLLPSISTSPVKRHATIRRQHTTAMNPSQDKGVVQALQEYGLSLHDLMGSSLTPLGVTPAPDPVHDKERFLGVFADGPRIWSIKRQDFGSSKVDLKFYSAKEVWDNFFFPFVSFEWHISRISAIRRPVSRANSIHGGGGRPSSDSVIKEGEAQTEEPESYVQRTPTFGSGRRGRGRGRGTTGGGHMRNGSGATLGADLALFHEQREETELKVYSSFTAWANPLDPDGNPLVARGSIEDTIIVNTVSSRPKIKHRQFVIDRIMKPEYLAQADRESDGEMDILSELKGEQNVYKYFRTYLKSSLYALILRKLKKLVNPLVAIAAVAASVQNLGIEGNAGLALASIGIFSASLGLIVLILDLLVDLVDWNVRRRQLRVLKAKIKKPKA
ncbi:hypothetical protein BT69DRAFT_1275330, partial [Atractiella rhizophila]